MKVLFIPVSGEGGTGEYYRCLAMAKSLHSVNTEVEIVFVINQSAVVERPPYIRYREVATSPKRCPELVSSIVAEEVPKLVIFDSTIRKSLLLPVKKAGAYCVYVSFRPSTRVKGFRFSALRYIDEHWIIASPGKKQLSTSEWLKKIVSLSRTKIRFFSGPPAVKDKAGAEKVMGRWGLRKGDFALFCPGGGGTMLDGKPSVAIFQKSARKFFYSTGFDVLFVAGPASNISLMSREGCREVRSLPSDIFPVIIDNAKIVISGGGSLALQVLGSKKPNITVNSGGSDQSERLIELRKAGVSWVAPADPQEIAEKARLLLVDDGAQGDMVASMISGGYADNGADVGQLIVDLLAGSGLERVQ